MLFAFELLFAYIRAGPREIPFSEPPSCELHRISHVAVADARVSEWVRLFPRLSPFEWSVNVLETDNAPSLNIKLHLFSRRGSRGTWWDTFWVSEASQKGRGEWFFVVASSGLQQKLEQMVSAYATHSPEPTNFPTVLRVQQFSG